MKLAALISRSIRWNTLEVFTYHSFLTIHYVALARVKGNEFLGATSAIFAAIYFLIPVMNFGLNDSLPAFWGRLMEDKLKYRNFLLTNIIPGLLIYLSPLLFLAPLLMGMQNTCRPPFFGWLFNFFHVPVEALDLILCLALFAAEGTKKISRSVLQLRFKNIAPSIIEVVALLAYLSIVWGSFCYAGQQLSLTLVLWPLVLTTALSSSIMLILAFMTGQGKQTSNLTDNQDLPPPPSVLKIRSICYFNRLVSTSFNSNMLTPITNAFLGSSITGYFVVANQLVRVFQMVLVRAFGSASGAAFTRLQRIKSKELSIHFASIIQKMGIFVICFLLFVVGAWKDLFVHTNGVDLFYQLCILLTISFVANSTIVYEKLLVSHSRVPQLLLFNISSICLAVPAIYIMRTEPVLAFSLIVFSRLLLLIVLAVYSARQMGTIPKLGFFGFQTLVTRYLPAFFLGYSLGTILEYMIPFIKYLYLQLDKFLILLLQ